MNVVPSIPFFTRGGVARALIMSTLGCLMFFAGASGLVQAATNDGEVLLHAGILSRGRFQVGFDAKTNQPYSIGVSEDLVHWTLLSNVVGKGELLWFSDFEAPKFEKRFYQITPPQLTNLVFIRPGTFLMGSPTSEVGHVKAEGPQTLVTLSRPFWIGKYEVTQEEYVAVTGTNVSWFQYDSKLPAELVSWDLATNYTARLTIRERAAGRLPAGYIYRLPTEAEWEYACRAGTTTPFGIGDGKKLSSTQANFDGNFPYGGAPSGAYVQGTIRPGTYAPNAWGIYDMHGNVWEWCQDWFGPYSGGSVTDPKGPATGTERVMRGGGYPSLAKGVRSSVRDSRRQGYADLWLGFRVVLGAE